MAVDVEPRSAYFAKSCPERVQLDVLWPCEPLPDSPFLRKLIESGHEYEGETFAPLFEDVEGVVIEAEDPDAREWQTMRALSDGAAVVAGGRLPVDHEAHRVGEPDLLVRSGEGYLPVDVKSHKAARRGQGGGRARRSSRRSTAPFLEAAAVDPEHDPPGPIWSRTCCSWRTTAALLERAGLAPAGPNVGGICGTEGVIVWYDLDAPAARAPEHPASAPGRAD